MAINPDIPFREKLRFYAGKGGILVNDELVTELNALSTRVMAQEQCMLDGFYKYRKHREQSSAAKLDKGFTANDIPSITQVYTTKDGDSSQRIGYLVRGEKAHCDIILSPLELRHAEFAITLPQQLNRDYNDALAPSTAIVPTQVILCNVNHILAVFYGYDEPGDECLRKTCNMLFDVTGVPRSGYWLYTERPSVHIPREYGVGDEEEAIETVMEMEREEKRRGVSALTVVDVEVELG
ncbi:Protein of unknown function [Pyronema omphalodes CBS 100304]|uniref:Uncharacterized protein n=1 Tax=Pyronema omphalodes (strain CBS 100304) TaxID=1076935 RepID=U4L9Q9_PYROM|nr:Protein of unknown function [Pyronema omphalodes CBS 100304]